MTNQNFAQLTRPINVLMAEDDDDDVFLIKKTFERDRLYVNINRVEDGVEALLYLRREGEYRDAIRPDLILLDLNMPRKDGREVLQEVKNDIDLRRIPVIVLTTSEDELDVRRSYHNLANSYVTKPVDLLQFRNAIQVLQDFWLSVVKLPPDMRPV